MQSDGRDTDSETSSSASSKLPSPEREEAYLPYQPKYSVQVTNPIKNGDIVEYTVKAIRISDGSEFVVRRRYEDFDYLNQCLTMQDGYDGIIVSLTFVGGSIQRCWDACTALMVQLRSGMLSNKVSNSPNGGRPAVNNQCY